MTLLHDSSGKGVGLENPLPTKVIESTIMQPVDIQSNYQQTIQTHNAVSIAASGLSAGTWVDCGGFDKLAVTLLNDATTSSIVDIAWSNDGVTQHGWERPLAATTDLTRAAIVDVKARYSRVLITNQDAIAHIMSAWAFLKA